MADATTNALALALMRQQGQPQRLNPLVTQGKYGQSLLEQGSQTTPLASPWAGLARALQGGLGGLVSGYAAAQQKDQDTKTIDSLSKLASSKTQNEFNANLGGLKDAGVDAETLAPVLAQVVGQRVQQFQNGVDGGQIGSAYGVPQSAPAGAPQGGTVAAAPGGSANANAIAGTESGGQPNNGYSAVGPVATPQGNRAYGRYQVLDSNIAPWTKEVLGQEMTPQQFLTSPQAQDAVFEKKFGQYVTQYGNPQAAARAWFAGPGGMNNPNATDVNGMTPQRYEQQFAQNGGNVSPQAAPGQSPPSPPVVPRPAPDPQVVQEVIGRVQRGLITKADGIKEIEANRDKNQQLLQGQADKTYSEQLGEYTTRRNIALQGAEHDRQQATATPNPEQALSGGFADRMARSNGIVGQIPADVQTSFKGKLGENPYIPFGAGNFLQSPAYQQYRQARDDFINAQLRRESGAAIAPTEYSNADRQYFPQPGDSKEVLAQKEVNRRLAVEGMVRNAGPAYQQSPTVSAPQAVVGSSPQAPAPAAPQPGAVMDGYRFKGGDPGKKENWEAAQ